MIKMNYQDMIRMRLAISDANSKIFTIVFAGLVVIFSAPFSHGFTNQQDVSAINSLYASLGSPPLPGWTQSGGDPCGEIWQGIQCVNSNITGIVLNAANLGGQLGDKLDEFSTIITIDLSNNHIGGSIPSNLPPTIKTFFLSANQFTGSIPTSLSTLTLLTDMSLNNNQLTGELPDAFQVLTGLINLDLSFNNLSGKLPPSLENLSSLTTFHVQDNQLSGTLDVLQDLPLKDLNVENNLFWGPVPEKMLSIPNFKKDGNPFNTTTAPSPAVSLPPPPPLSEGPTPGTTPGKTPGKSANGPSIQDDNQTKKNGKSRKTTKIVAYAFVGLILFLVAILAVMLLIRYCRKESEVDKITRRQETGVYKKPREKPKGNESLIQPANQIEKVPSPKVAVQKPVEEHQIDMPETGLILLPPPVEKVVVEPVMPPKLPKDVASPAVTSFTVASLQQYTNSFGQENRIGVGMLGSVYRAELPNGQFLAVKKLDNASNMLQTDEDFLDLVLSISKLKHANVVELVGYCMEHGQRLLVYEYCNNGTLIDVLHSGEELEKKLSWNARIRIALGAAGALEYLHEVCQPPVVHRNFKSANLLLDDELGVRASDCGLAPLIMSGSVRQLSGNILSSLGYGAPEFIQSGTYTCKSDVYSFGVVMLELLTGRKSYDSSRPRGEQHLARWAVNHLHDIASLSRMVDPSLRGKYPEKSLSWFADIISICIQAEPEFRPPMSEIVQELMRMMPREPSSSRTSNKDSSNLG
ncbi:protein STRUBBELIG-RECEPTOR FAMILY 3-like [Magnolia sinica]|uniref:protein STRUBBELIG-RECEPTOR FAMILY 3-like n=1 Tax=Magnolia sinica TaxID=86752 RepID=UPI00265940D9|nr:protein STRUBBELIG-RECEPTOR FAMILY 3-like [Magnolia sinica]XP_058083043.1 protein STRUBBELIG-RECEPTOR FAMILY 3-like [Magnolia sinica]